MRTNPAYAALAYRKAIIGQVIADLTAHYTSAMGDDPKRVIICEEVLHADAEVPVEEIGMFLGELHQQEETLRLELLKFEFVRRKDEQKAEQVRKPKQPKAAASKRGRAARGKAAAKRGQ